MYEQFWKERIPNLRVAGNQINGDCPLCNKAKHFYASAETGQFDCKHCGKNGNAITYLKDYENKDNKQIAECLKSYGINGNNYVSTASRSSIPCKQFDEVLVKQYVANLSDVKLKEFSEERGLPVEVLKKYKIGINERDEFTLPVYDAEGRIRDIRRKKIGGDTISSAGAEVFLFGIQDLLCNNRIFITEGEWSKMALEVQGYPSVGIPGASTFKDEWVPYFKDKEVNIVYDLDAGGENGTKIVIKKLISVAKSIRVIHLPKELGEGKDVRDFFNNGGSKEQFEKLISQSADLVLSAVKNPEYRLTDLGNAEWFISRHKDNLRYCHPWGKWLVWDGKRWVVDATAEAWRYAIETVRSIYSEAGLIEDKDLRKRLAEHATRCESKSKIEAMLLLGTKQKEVPVLPLELDKNQMLFNVLNGTVDLRIGELRPHSKQDLITKLAPVNYCKEAICPKWLTFLDEIMLNNKELVSFLKRMVGYCLTGQTGEHKLFFLFGGGSNGKSTFLKVMQGVLGDYAIKAASDILIANKGDSHTTGITDLKGARLAITIEIQEGRQLAESVVKELTGGDSITARRMREDNMTFEPTHKIILAANHKPIVHETTQALWRRIDLIPFNYVFSEKERIKDYHEILVSEEKDGIFRWALEGCLEWQEMGLSESQEVIAATKEYRTEMDILGDFIDDCCVVGQNKETKNKELREQYDKWCQDNGEKPVSPKTFSTKLQERGFIKGRTGQSRFWKGIGIKDDSSI